MHGKFLQEHWKWLHVRTIRLTPNTCDLFAITLCHRIELVIALLYFTIVKLVNMIFTYSEELHQYHMNESIAENNENFK